MARNNDCKIKVSGLLISTPPCNVFNMLETIGKTIDGKSVVRGVFEMYDTQGLPLTEVFNQLKEHNSVPEWASVFKSAKKAGWKRKTFESRMHEAVIDIWGPDFWNGMQEKFKICLDHYFPDR